MKLHLLLCGDSHAVPIEAVNIIMLPPVLHSVHANCFGIQDFVKNILEKIYKKYFKTHFAIVNFIILKLCAM